MVTVFSVGIILISIHKFSFGCKPLWDNHCKANWDCCTGNCDRPPFWEFGVCKPANSGSRSHSGSGGDSGCKPLWYNLCIVNSDCCSNFCARGHPSWLYGVCNPTRPPLPGKKEETNRVNAMCGVASNSASPVLSFGQHTERGAFPWHAGIYKNLGNTWTQICGGTLISRTVVISAAHCFDVEDKKNMKIYIASPLLFKVAVGKYNRDLDSDEDMAQIVTVKKIQFSPQYQGSIGMYANDIAFVTLNTAVEYTKAVRPVCVNVDSEDFENKQLRDGVVGRIVGWGLTEEQKPSDVLLGAKMPYVSLDECKRKDPINRAYYKRDKLCAGDLSSNINVCSGDSGGGLVFEDKNTGKYYLRGVVSLGPAHCSARGWSMFTKISAHKDLVKMYLRL